MLGVLGLAVVVGAIIALTESGRDAARQVRAVYRRRRDAWLNAHPGSVAPARFAGVAATVIHGPRPAWRAFRSDWRRHYREARDRVRARYGRPVSAPPAAGAPTAPAPAAGQRSRRVDGRPETDADRRFFDQREAGYTGPIDQDGNPVPSLFPEAPPAAAPAGRPALTVIDGGARRAATIPEGAPVPTEIHTIEALRAAQYAVVARCKAEVDDKQAAVARAQDLANEAAYIADAAPAVLDRDQRPVVPIIAQVDPAGSRVEAERAALSAAEQQLALAEQALAALAAHRAMEEARSATPQAATRARARDPVCVGAGRGRVRHTARLALDRGAGHRRGRRYGGPRAPRSRPPPEAAQGVRAAPLAATRVGVRGHRVG
jgi:hypothetical protein